MKKLLFALAFFLAPFAAFGQSTPGLYYGQVPTPAQWNSYFAAKQDTLTPGAANTTVLHGNPGGLPSWGQVNLATDVTGVLSVAHGGTGGILDGAHGGTGIANSAKTITIGASVITTGAGAPTLAFPSSPFTYTFQGSSDTIVGRATTDTLTNKTLTAPAISSPTISGTVAGANTHPLTTLAQSGANTMLGNWTSGTANVVANAMGSCPDTAGNHLNYVSGTGITCGTSGPSVGPLWKITRSGTQTIPVSQLYLLQGNSSVYDTASICNTTTTFLCTPSASGYYHLTCTARIDGTAGPGTSAAIARVVLYKNPTGASPISGGTPIPGGDVEVNAQTNLGAVAATGWVQSSADIQLNGTSDTVGCIVYGDNASGQNVVTATWSGFFIRP